MTMDGLLYDPGPPAVNVGARGFNPLKTPETRVKVPVLVYSDIQQRQALLR